MRSCRYLICVSRMFGCLGYRCRRVAASCANVPDRCAFDQGGSRPLDRRFSANASAHQGPPGRRPVEARAGHDRSTAPSSPDRSTRRTTGISPRHLRPARATLALPNLPVHPRPREPVHDALVAATLPHGRPARRRLRTVRLNVALERASRHPTHRRRRGRAREPCRAVRALSRSRIRRRAAIPAAELRKRGVTRVSRRTPRQLDNYPKLVSVQLQKLRVSTPRRICRAQ